MDISVDRAVFSATRRFANIVEQPDGIKIASTFIVFIIVVSFISRALRSTELRVERVELNDTARQFIEEAKPARFVSSPTVLTGATSTNIG